MHIASFVKFQHIYCNLSWGNSLYEVQHFLSILFGFVQSDHHINIKIEICVLGQYSKELIPLVSPSMNILQYILVGRLNANRKPIYPYFFELFDLR